MVEVQKVHFLDPKRSTFGGPAVPQVPKINPGSGPLASRTHVGSLMECHLFKVNFTFSAHLMPWPKMTFDFGVWPFVLRTYEGSHIASIIQARIQSDFIFSNEITFHIFSLFYHLTLTFDLPSWHDTSHVASMTPLWLKSIRKCEVGP